MLDLGVGQTLTTDGKGDIDVSGHHQRHGGQRDHEAGRRHADRWAAQYVRRHGQREPGRGQRNECQRVWARQPADVREHRRGGASFGRREHLAENFVIRDVGVGFDQTTMGSIRSIGRHATR